MRKARGHPVLLIALLLAVGVVPASSEASGMCLFNARFEWTGGPGPYHVTLSGTQEERCMRDTFARFSTGDLLIQAEGTAAHVGRCSRERLGDLPWPWIDGVFMTGAVYSVSAGEVIERFKLVQGPPPIIDRSLFPSQQPVHFVYHRWDDVSRYHLAGEAAFATRVYGNCPPAGNPKAFSGIVTLR